MTGALCALRTRVRHAFVPGLGLALLFAATTVRAQRGVVPIPQQPVFGDPLGAQWDVVENGLRGVWTRRPGGNTFDAVWPSVGIRAVLEMTLVGTRVSIARRQSSDGNNCDYVGELTPPPPDTGPQVNGTYTCTRFSTPMRWSATVRATADAAASGTGPVQDDVQRCMAGLNGSSSGQRAAAADCLGKMGARAAAAVPALVDMLADASTEYWDGLGPDGRLTGGSFSARESAGRALVGIGEPALQPLIDALGKHPGVLVREGAAEVLSRFNTVRAIEPLVRALGDETIVKGSLRRSAVLRDTGPTRVCDVAAHELASMGGGAVGDALWSHSSDGPPAETGRVLAVLVQRKDARTLPIVTRNMASASWQTRLTAVNQMAGLAPPDLISVLLPVLKDADPRVQAAAVEGLGKAALAEAIGSPEIQRVVLALEALQRDTLEDIQRRSKAYQISNDVLDVASRIHDALTAIAEKRKHSPQLPAFPDRPLFEQIRDHQPYRPIGGM